MSWFCTMALSISSASSSPIIDEDLISNTGSRSLEPVFEIKSSSMIGDDDAEEMESAIVQNQDMLSYWTNFDSWIDWVTLLFWVGGIAMIAMGMIGAGNASTESDSLATAAAIEDADDEADSSDGGDEDAA